MADDKKPTPPADFSELVTQWERNFNEFSNQMMGSDEFARSMNQMQNVQMDMQRNFSESMAKQLANFNIPSRDDIVAVAQQLRDIDARLARIEKATFKNNDSSEAPKAKAKAKKKPTRTRKPPSTADGAQS
jgi:hypothetical protein